VSFRLLYLIMIRVFGWLVPLGYTFEGVAVGPDGALGGEGADRVAGFWRVIGVSPPAEPDHLSSLLSRYASLGQAAADSTRAAIAAALARAGPGCP